MARWKLAVFDLDGTLLDTLGDLAAACNHALRLANLPEHPVEAYRGFIGSGAANLIKRAIPLEYREQTTVLQFVLDHFTAHYNAHAQDLTKPYDGVTGLLENLRRQGTRVAVLSNKPHRYVPALLEHYFPGLIDLGVGQREGVPIKPDPRALLEIIAHFNLDKDSCVYVGDSDVDMITGRNAGLCTIGVCWGFCTKKDLMGHEHSYLVDKVGELDGILIDKG